MKRAILDTNVYVDWLNDGLHENLVLGPGMTRLLSSVVLMELGAGAVTRRARKAVERLHKAYAVGQRIAVPSASTYWEAGGVLERLRRRGREVRRASFVHDVLIALTARAVGAVVFTRDASDFEAISTNVNFVFEVLRV